jgi:hypothetical protein
MASMTCAACGSDLLDPEARFCSACGAPVPEAARAADGHPEPTSEDGVAEDVTEASALDGDQEQDVDSDAAETSGELSKYALEVPSRNRLTDEQWQYATWGAVAVGVVAIVALVAVIFGPLSSGDETPRSPVPAAGEPTTTTTEAPRIGIVTEFPVTAPSVVESPQLGGSAGYLQDWAYIAVRLTADTCERRDGMLRASGTIRNETRIGQTLDYDVAVEMTRRVVGSSLASLETTVEDLGPHETAEWSVEAVSTRTVNVACDVVALTVSPSERS